MDDVLFPGYEAPPVEDLSADRRRTLRQQAQIAAGVHPLTRGPIHRLASRHRDADAPKRDPFTCGSCWFRSPQAGVSGTYQKCTADDGARITRGPGSDVRAWWPACPDYTPADTGLSPDAARTVYPATEA